MTGPNIKKLLEREEAESRPHREKAARLKAALDRETMIDAAHLLNKLRGEREREGNPLTNAEDGAFWSFIHLLPKEDQESIIN